MRSTLLELSVELLDDIFILLLGGEVSLAEPLDFYHHFYMENTPYARLKALIPATYACRALYNTVYRLIYNRQVIKIRCQPPTYHWTPQLRFPQESFLRCHGNRILQVQVDVFVLVNSSIKRIPDEDTEFPPEYCEMAVPRCVETVCLHCSILN